ncbi:SDR family NAD(P)-dependent oxidoreductase [Chloroflexota bacterium]
MAKEFKGKNAIVTGAGRGIGREVALAFAGEGANVVVVDPGVARDGSGTDSAPADEVVQLIREMSGSAIPVHESVADFAAAERITKTCLDNFGSIDILFNGAGVLRERMVYNMSEDDWDSVVSVHLKGAFNMCRHVCVMMRQQKYGRIINVVSGAWLGVVGQCNYSAAKAGMVGLTRSIAREMGRYGATCNAISPGAATRMTVTEEVKAGWKKGLEMGALSKQDYDLLTDMPGPEYVPPAVLFLASDAAADINGQVLGIFGGRMSIYSEPTEARILAKDYRKHGPWTLDELKDLIPKNLLVGYVNPAPVKG